jgi:hypothetical protein
MKISVAMNFKRGIKTTCGVELKMLDTLREGMILFVEKRMVDKTSFDVITDYATQHKLNLVMENGCYYISADTLAPTLISTSLASF